MREDLYPAAIGLMIRRSADRKGLWAVSSKKFPDDCSERVWWFGLHSDDGRRISPEKGFVDREAIV